VSNNNIYTDEEQAILDKVKKVRLDIIDTMTKAGVPDRVGEIRVLNEVLASTDKMVVDTANIRVKKQEADNNGANADLVAEMFKQVRSRAAVAGVGKIPEISDAAKKVSTVAGELDINPEPLNPKDYIAPQFDPSKVK